MESAALCRYLYEIQQEKGVKRLVKIVYGTPIEVASKGDGGKFEFYISHDSFSSNSVCVKKRIVRVKR